MLSTELLTDLINRKHRILVQMRDVGRRQMEFVAGRDTASLIKLLATKQNLITALQAVERELSPFSAEDPERRRWASAEARAQCAGQAAECNAMLREIVGMEKQGVDQLTSHRNEIADRLQHAHAASDVRNAYQAQR
jgi:hypothetical protein